MDLKDIFAQAKIDNNINNEEYLRWGVKKGLRNEDGTGVLVGLTRIADVVGYQMVDGKKIDDYGSLYYRGISLEAIVEGLQGKRFGFEEVAFLIIFGHLPNKDELQEFISVITEAYPLPTEFLLVNVLANPTMNVMNKIQRNLLMLYEMDENPDDGSSENVLRQGLNVIAKLPSIIAYGYQVKKHLLDKQSLVIHQTDQSLSLAELLLSLLRPDGSYTDLEAYLLDLMLILHIDHGAGNNSTFTSIVVSSTGTDLYSALSAAVGSLKGPKHGGANICVSHMMKTVISDIGTDASDEQIVKIINRLLDKDYFDNSGLVYGLGHAVYTLSDPRCELLRKKAKKLAEEKGCLAEYEFLVRFETLAKEVIYERKGKRVCANVDFYSGFVYDLLDIPEDLFTPLFVMARTVGWIAHIIENKLYCSRIIRPAGKYVGEIKDYIKREDR